MYFPKLIAGPIVRAVDFLPQLKRGIRPSTQDIEIGCAYFLVGAVKKLVIADHLASHVGMILAAPQHFNAFTLVQGLVGYTGTDLRRFLGLLGHGDRLRSAYVGFRFPNFIMPYSSVNFAEFWRRWHVTLSSWFRDYVLLTLGGEES